MGIWNADDCTGSRLSATQPVLVLGLVSPTPGPVPLIAGPGHWGGPVWRDRFLLGFLDPKLVSRKITFFDPLKEQKVWKTCEG